MKPSSPIYQDSVEEVASQMGTFLGYPQTASAKNLTMDYLQNLKVRFQTSKITSVGAMRRFSQKTHRRGIDDKIN